MCFVQWSIFLIRLFVDHHPYLKKKMGKKIEVDIVTPQSLLCCTELGQGHILKANANYLHSLHSRNNSFQMSWLADM